MKVGLVYDALYMEHDTGRHMEHPSRLASTVALLEDSGTMAQLVPLTPRAATAEELQMVHAPGLISYVETCTSQGGGWLDIDTVVSPASYRVACYAAGGTIAAVDAVMRGKVESAFALVRPPGHHALRLEAMGFCVFNNIAIAARHAIRNHGLERILIVDFDVHHGNGTQEAFYSDPGVLYFSTHQHPLYPGTGLIEETGSGLGLGATVNVPLPPRCGDEEYLQAFEEILVPAARGFQPQLILVSAGYDAHWADRISMMQVSVTGFGRMAGIIKGLAEELCDGRTVFTLEGGYDLDALAFSVKATLDVLLESPDIADPLGKASHLWGAPPIDSLLQAVRESHPTA
ncbi:MAG: histone deacetylase [Chloroflexota bacterium]|nr:histone deacetylase [Chloroflexota bacterium]